MDGRASGCEGTSMPLSYGQQDHLNWRKAIRSMNNGACAEVAATGGMVIVRDSKDLEGPIVGYPAATWRSFLTAARLGNFDALRQ